MRNPYDSLSTHTIITKIQERAEWMYGLQVEMKDLIDELEARQNKDRPEQLDLF